MPPQTDPSGIPLGQGAGGTKQFAITPHDTNELPVVVRAVRVGNIDAGAAVRFVAFGDTDPQTWNNGTAGEIIPMYVKKVLSTGTTASDLLGLY